MELTHERSVEAAKVVKEMAEIARTLDVEYLKEAWVKMKDQHSLRDSTMILNPNPHTAIESQDLNAAKIKGLELMLALAENQNEILAKELKLAEAKNNSRKLSDFFGV